MFDDDALPERIRDCLMTPLLERAETVHYPADYFASPPRQAAVLVPLVRRIDGWHLLFIRRAINENDRHSGQVAFPGGRVDVGDPTLEAAALREAEEEIGLRPANVRLLGTLCTHRTASNYRVTSVVGQIPAGFQPAPAPCEVERVFTIPLRWLATPGHCEWRAHRLPNSDQCVEHLYYQIYDGELLWGLTARLVADFIDRIRP